ncbi:MAG: hypothetical protein IKJ68_00095 [Clostridia bacterium]|nr:hypothetical protein [Clostridia bacterium]
MSRLTWKRFGIADVKKYDAVVGIDFGHRQMSAHYVKLCNNANEKFYKNEPQRAYLNKNEESVIPTQFAKVGDKIILGDEAVGYDNIYIYFKRDPEKLSKGVKYETGDIPCKELVQEFISQIIKNIEKYNADLIGSKILYVIGCPSGDVWFRDNNDVKYAEILKGKIDRDIVVMHESRGSLIKLKNERSVSFKRMEGILVFDFGSSTADWTFMYIDKNGVARMIDDTAMLGASLIDMKIMDVILGENHITRNELARYTDSQIETITAKELAYDSYGMPKHIKNILFYELKNGNDINYNVKPELLETVTGNEEVSYTTARTGEVTGTWESLCHSFMASAKSAIESKLPDVKIKNIMLTGGASKMYFIEDICKKVFDCSADAIIKDEEPSACVSKGLAYAGQADIEAQFITEDVVSKIEAYLKSDKDGDTCQETAEKIVANAIANNDTFFHEVFTKALDEWASPRIADLSSQSTIRHLISMTNTNGNDYLKSDKAKSAIDASVDATVKYYTDYVKNLLSETVKKHYNTDIPDTLNIDLSKHIDSLKSVISGLQINFISDNVVKALLGFSDGGMVNLDALRYLNQTNIFGGALESRSGLIYNYRTNKTERKELASKAMILSMYNALKGNSKLGDLAKVLEEKINEGVNEVIDSMALYAQK